MEFLGGLAKAIILLPFGALVDVPFLRLSARFLALRRLSFGAAYMLALITGGVLLVASLIVSPLLSMLPPLLQSAAAVALSIAIAGWVAGYLVTTEEHQSIGFATGTLLVFGASVLFLVAAAALALAFGGLFSVKP